jgi:hypothetical protein
MLTYGNERVITGAAHIVISLEGGQVHAIHAIFRDSYDCVLPYQGDAQMLRADIPMLLDELRMQLLLGRRLTIDESEPFKRKRRLARENLGQSSASGSAVTE